MVNTYSIFSDTLTEYFVDEDRRLLSHTTQGAVLPLRPYDAIIAPANLAGQWVSATALGDGEALLFNRGLVYPTYNFNAGFLPATGTQPNYSGFVLSTQYYVRGMYKAATPMQSGIIYLSGWVFSDFDVLGAPTAIVELKLPTQTDWINLGAPFNTPSFPILPYGTNPGAWAAPPAPWGVWGCFVADPLLPINQFRWSCGVFNTVNSGFEYIIRITILSPTCPLLTGIVETGW